MPAWYASALQDPVLRWALYVIAALAVVTLLTMVQVLVLSELGARRLARRQQFEAAWRPRLAEATAHSQSPPPWAPPEPGERLWFLLLWCRTQRQLRGEAHARLNRLLVDYGLHRVAHALLGRRQVHLRLIALAVLRQVGGPESWNDVARFLAHRNPFLSLAAAEVLVTLDPHRAMAGVLPVVVVRRDWTPQRIAALCRVAGRTAVSAPLLAALRNAAPEREHRLAGLAAWADPARLAGWARDVLGGPRDPRVHQAALQVLGELRDAADRPLLLAAIADPDADVRLAALKALRKQAVLAELDTLCALLPDPSWAVRQEAADTIAAQPGFDRLALEQLIETVDDRYGQDALRRAIAERHP
ncbi:HEAT repeat domain-containing protein [Luteimonas deserti]|uniref:HEAT repeat domain-containing protein n=1 Tax=Luteimonas deserti TaxID=2752306 RepID=A0A7Z0QPM5_9GAMM|nr:HEAT repeat domain-containing protein [Luteimonas deserti]NYZ61874.1 HEAT repeat domain-containing protein [Luteimonas deserti]